MTDSFQLFLEKEDLTVFFKVILVGKQARFTCVFLLSNESGFFKDKGLGDLDFPRNAGDMVLLFADKDHKGWWLGSLP